MRKYLGVATNNVAEYEALLMALRFATAFGLKDVKVFTDSKLIAEQVAARWAVYDKELSRLRLQAHELISQLSSFSIKHIPREKNKRADKLANAAIDEVVENG
jgi:ribonuclease HI